MPATPTHTPSRPNPNSDSTQLPRNWAPPNTRPKFSPFWSTPPIITGLAGFLAFFPVALIGFFLGHSTSHLTHALLGPTPFAFPFIALGYAAPSLALFMFLTYVKSQWQSAPLTGYLVAAAIYPFLFVILAALYLFFSALGNA